MDKGLATDLAAFRDAMLGKAPAPITSESLANTTRTTFRILEAIAVYSVMRV